MTDRPDEFAWISRLAALTRGDSRALDLSDDAAIIPSRPGFDLVVSKDALVEGVHFLPGQPLDLVARRLLRTSLSDLAAKAAEPFGYFLMTAWPADRGWAERDAFIAGLAEDGALFGVSLLGGDTVATPGPLTLSATVMGWTPSGGAVLRSGARQGDLVMVCGCIGDGWLGLQAVLGKLEDPTGRLTKHFETPEPLFALSALLRAYARAAADVSDGLIADLGHVARASGLAAVVDLEGLPLSAEAKTWCGNRSAEARLTLATGGDDYAIVCAVAPADADTFLAGVRALGLVAACVGSFSVGSGVRVCFNGQTVDVVKPGWTHSL